MYLVQRLESRALWLAKTGVLDGTRGLMHLTVALKVLRFLHKQLYATDNADPRVAPKIITNHEAIRRDLIMNETITIR